MNFKGIFFEIDDFELTNTLLGEGNFGKVYVAKYVNRSDIEYNFSTSSNSNKRNLEINKEYAAKIIKVNVNKGFTGKDQMKLMRESTILHKLDHPSIVKFYGINFQSFDQTTKLEPAIITEFLPNGSLLKIIHFRNKIKSPNFSWDSTMKYICLVGIANAMKYLHEQGFIHRDLKSENILMDENFNPKICDFGLSRCFPETLSTSVTNGIGTPIYMAPELFDCGFQCNEKVDVFAFAVLAYEIVSEKVPYSELPKDITYYALGNRIVNGYRPRYPNGFPEKLKGLIDQCWSQNPSERPSFEEIFTKLSTDFSYLNEKLDEDKIREYIQKVYRPPEVENSNFASAKSQIEELKSSLLSACQEGNVEQVRNILSLGILDVNCRYKIGDDVKTLLHVAVEKENIDIVKLLLKCEGIDVNIKETHFYPFEKYEEKDDIKEIQDDIDEFEEIDEILYILLYDILIFAIL